MLFLSLERGRSSYSRFMAAHSNFAHESLLITRGAGPIRLRMERGVRKTRDGLKWMGIHPHSWQSRKKRRTAPRKPHFARGSKGCPKRFTEAGLTCVHSPAFMSFTAATTSVAIASVTSAG